MLEAGDGLCIFFCGWKLVWSCFDGKWLWSDKDLLGQLGLG